jgi:putative hydrolase of the HAD superfamily
MTQRDTSADPSSVAPLIRAVIFDLDGTLLDHVGSVTTALRNWLPTLRATATEDLVTEWFEAEHRYFPAWRSREISFAEQRRRRLRDFLPLLNIAPGDDHALDAAFAGYLSHYEAAWTKFDDVDLALAQLDRTHLRIALLTNGTVEQQTAKLKAIGLDGRVGPVCTAEALGAAKPDPTAYLAVCDELGVEPDSAVHIGDLYDLDVLAARAAGLRAIHLDRYDAGPHDEPNRITSLRQLPEQLRPAQH